MRRALSLVAVVLVVACNSVLNIPEAHLKTDTTLPTGDDDDDDTTTSSSGSSGDCASGEKKCGGKCVGTDDPATGCGNDSCTPCQAPNAKVGCNDQGQCVAVSCLTTFSDCNKNVDDGCEVDVSSDREHCSACDNPCGQGLACENSVCRCNDDQSQCGDRGTGCGTDPDDEGRCYCDNRGNPCAIGSACDDNGKCIFGPPFGQPTGG